MDKALFRIFLVFMALGLSNMALAQESGFPGEEEEQSNTPRYQEEEYTVRESGMTLPEGTAIQAPGEKKSESSSTDTPVKKITTVPSRSSTTGEGQKESKSSVDSKAEDESVLSYNFLFYLIQKFKFDTVE